MKADNKEWFTCGLTGAVYPKNQVTHADYLRPSISQLIKAENPNWNGKGYISVEALNKYREQYVEQLLKDESGDLNNLQKQVLQSMRMSQMVSRDIEPEMERDLTIGERLADKIAEFGGSWAFILSFFSFLIGWILINLFLLGNKAYDPYPFILLNLILSCLAAIQAPIIMMSQNRQEDKDRTRSQHDYQVNLKAELEIQQLHEKLDHLMLGYSQRMLEIQQIQLETMNNIIEQLKIKPEEQKEP
ncbi:MAG: DUF1003 domain-containing protein [Chitinophagales bacterium]|nr:DUF1003 domain-containing protein [Chitinophagales bacterium]